jgi:DNA mismatch endonuclease Vsr
VDNLTAEERLRCMRSVRRTGTRDEERVAETLDAMRLSYAWGAVGLPGSPDFVLKDARAAVFVHGCFARARGMGGRLRGRAVPGAKIAKNRHRAAVLALRSAARRRAVGVSPRRPS